MMRFRKASDLVWRGLLLAILFPSALLFTFVILAGRRTEAGNARAGLWGATAAGSAIAGFAYLMSVDRQVDQGLHLAVVLPLLVLAIGSGLRAAACSTYRGSDWYVDEFGSYTRHVLDKREMPGVVSYWVAFLVAFAALAVVIFGL